MDIEKELLRIVKQKEVLEIGGLGDFDWYMSEKFVTWRHAKFKRVAKTIKGIDINTKYVEQAKREGFDYHVADIEDRNILSGMGQYDVILLLDVIEHLSNVGIGLGNIKNLLKTGGKLVITTPNPYSFNNILRLLTRRNIAEYQDHTCNLLISHFEQLFLRIGLRIKKADYITFSDKRTGYNIKSDIIKSAGRIIPMFNTHLFILGEKNET